MDNLVTEWSLDGVLDDMKRIDLTMKDRQFAFILGAGASRTSGIPTGQELAKRWLEDIHLRECLVERPLREWLYETKIIDEKLTIENSGEFYPEIFEHRFRCDKEAGYAELEAAMEGKLPSLGYSLLAEIIQNTRHKVVVTTNFDNLVADALAMHAHQSPLVVAHESLAGFVRPQMRRPLVAKIHRDLYLNPINDPAGVSKMEKGWKLALKRLFQYFTPVVVGYGGNDGSLMDMLMDLEPGDISGRMVWCYREGSPPPEKALNVLRKHNGLLVKVPGFDQFMLRLAAQLVTDFDVAAIAERTAELGQERARRYREQAIQLRDTSIHGSPAERRGGEVLSQSVRSDQSWWAWDMKAQAETDIESRRSVYLEGLRHFPDSADLIGNYAFFLSVDCDENEQADVEYKKAMKIDPHNANLLNDYAGYLSSFTEDYDLAEEHFKKSIQLDPENQVYAGTYARFLAEIRGNLAEAEQLFKQVISEHPDSGWLTCTYANFIRDHLDHEENYDLLGSLYTRALEYEPENHWVMVNCAIYLGEISDKRDEAVKMFEKAISLAPDYEEWPRERYQEFLHLKSEMGV